MLPMIKFRGMNHLNKYEYGDLIHNTINSANQMIEVGIKKANCYAVEVYPESVVRFVQFDKNNNEIYEKDRFRFKYLKELDQPIQLIGSFIWNQDELSYEIDIEENDYYSCLRFVGNGTFYDFELL